MSKDRLSSEQRKRIPSLGGKAAQAKGTGHRFSKEEAQWAGRIGGIVTSSDREHMAAIGKRGGIARGENKGQRQKPNLKYSIPDFTDADVLRDMGDR